MTTETKTFIDFSDIVAIEMRCSKCGTTASRTFDEFKSAAYECPNCGESLVMAEQSDALNLMTFVRSLKHIQSIAPSSKLRLQITPSTSQTSADRQ
jgi:ribosomal protein S27AE